MQILIIEDDTLWQEKLQTMLENIGYADYRIATDIIETKGILALKKPDIIIADIMLANGTVFSAFRTKELKQIPIIFLTASHNVEYANKTQLFSNTLLLIKPIHQLTLQSSIRSLLKFNNAHNDENKIEQQGITVLSNTIKDLKLLDTLNINDTEKKIFEEKWYKQMSYKQIGESMNISSERVRKKYIAALRKLKTKLLITKKNIDAYLEFKKVRYNNDKLKKIKKGEKEFLEIDKLSIHIDELIEIPTKYRNILKERDITRLGDLTNVTFRQLAMTKHLGNGSAKMIEDAIAKFGVKLKN